MMIAEDMINGSCCSLCGQYFEDKKSGNKLFTHGYPVYCWDCWETDCGHSKAETNTL